MSWSTFLSEHASDLIAFGALSLLGYQIWSANRQFGLLNKGYLNAAPRIDPARSDIVAPRKIQFGGAESVDPAFPVEALNPVITLENVGNLPLKYRVLRFDVWIDGVLRTKPFGPADHVIGLLFPKTGTEFRIPGILLNSDSSPLPFSAVIRLQLRVHVAIEYNAGNEHPCLCDREYDFRLLANGGDMTIRAINDRW